MIQDNLFVLHVYKFMDIGYYQFAFLMPQIHQIYCCGTWQQYFMVLLPPLISYNLRFKSKTFCIIFLLQLSSLCELVFHIQQMQKKTGQITLKISVQDAEERRLLMICDIYDWLFTCSSCKVDYIMSGFRGGKSGVLTRSKIILTACCYCCGCDLIGHFKMILGPN